MNRQDDNDGLSSERIYNWSNWRYLQDINIVEASLANLVQRTIQDLVDASIFDTFFPDVIISYSTGHRLGVDAESAGPGLLIAAGVIQYLFDSGVPCYSDLMTPAGYDWREYMLRVQKAKVMVALVSGTSNLSVHCLREVAAAVDNDVEVIPVRIDEASVDGIDITRDVANMWPDHELENYARNKGNPARVQRKLELQRLFARDCLCKASSLPVRGTLLSDRDALHALVGTVRSALASMQHSRAQKEKSSEPIPHHTQPLAMDTSASSASSSLSGGFLVGVEFSGANMEERTSWNDNVLRSKRQIETMLSKLLKFGELSSGEPEMTVETINEDGLERAVVQLECEIYIHSDLESYKYKRVREICRKIARLLETAGATNDELRNLMIGAAWQGSLYLLVAAPSTLFDKFMSFFALKGHRLSLGVYKAVIVDIAPAFSVGSVLFNQKVARNRSLLPHHQLDEWPGAVAWQDFEMTLLIPTSVSSFKSLVTGSVTPWERDTEEHWTTMARILPIREAPLHTAGLVKAILETDVHEETDIPVAVVTTDDNMAERDKNFSTRCFGYVFFVLSTVFFILSVLVVSQCSFILFEDNSELGIGLFSRRVDGSCKRYNDIDKDAFDAAFKTARAFGVLAVLATGFAAVVCIPLMLNFNKMKVGASIGLRLLFPVAFVCQILTFTAFASDICDTNVCGGGSTIAIVVANLFLIFMTSIIACCVPCLCKCFRGGEEGASDTQEEIKDGTPSIVFDQTPPTSQKASATIANLSKTVVKNQDESKTITEKVVNPDGSKTVTITVDKSN